MKYRFFVSVNGKVTTEYMMDDRHVRKVVKYRDSKKTNYKDLWPNQNAFEQWLNKEKISFKKEPCPGIELEKCMPLLEF